MKEVKVKNTIDLTKENYNTLEKYINKNSKKISMAYIINNLIGVLNIDKDIRKKLLNYCINELKNIDKEYVSIDTFWGCKIKDEKGIYINLIKILDWDYSIEVNGMKKVRTKEGYMIFPDEWIILNEDKAIYSEEVMSIEIKKLENEEIVYALYFIDNNFNRKELENEILNYSGSFGVLNRNIGIFKSYMDIISCSFGTLIFIKD